jgi:AraC-like DNA-binding protein
MLDAPSTFAEHYATSPYAAFDQERRHGGPFGVEMLHVEQDGHEFPAPPLPWLTFVGSVKVGPTAELDFGDGWRRHSALRGGMVDLQPANRECRFRIRDPHTILIVSLDIRSVTRHLDEVGLSADPFEPLYAAMAGGPDELRLMQTMWAAAQVGGAANDLLIDGCALALLGRFAAMAEQEGAWRAPVLEDARLARAVDYVEAHLAEPIRMEDLAAVACLSLVHFSRAFKSATGQSPHAYLTGRRVARAKRLLTQTPLPIMQVGHACGFNSPAHFAATFRARTGASPSQYRADRRD